MSPRRSTAISAGDPVDRRVNSGAAGNNGIWRLGSCQIELRALLNEPPLELRNRDQHIGGSSLFVISTP
jgi:hypothetical protein